MEILQLKYFMRVAQKENISQVAEEYMVPPSSVSVAIKKLETELGMTLFERSANRIRLNAQGKIFLSGLEAAYAAIEGAKVQMQNLSQAVAGELKILILTNRSRVMEMISKFRADYPQVFFNIRHSGREQFKEYDLIVADKLPESDAFVKRLLCREEMLLAVSENHKLAGEKSVRLSELGSEKFICMPHGSSLGDFTRVVLKTVGISPEIAIECDDPQYIRAYLKMGLGVSFFPIQSWEKQIEPSLRLLKIDGGLHRETYIYIRKDASYTAKMFAKLLADIK